MKRTTLCYIENNDSFLMLYRNKKKNDDNEGKWLGIGGKIEPGETPDECCVREVFEETGIRLNSQHFYGVIYFRSDEYEDEDMYLYSSKDFELPDELQECDEGELRWIPKTELLTLPMWAGDHAFLEKILDGDERITMTLQYIGNNCKIKEDIMSDIMERISAAEEVVWINPNLKPAAEALATIEYTAADVEDAAKRLERFAPLIMHYFPETKETNGIIESPLTEIPNMKAVLNEEGAQLTGRLFLKRDSDLKVAGSVKARGGVYEVLKHSEDLAIEAGILSGYDDDYLKLGTSEAREFFSQFKVQVGSTGNLGMSIGIMSAALGYEAIVHMSMDAKQWKKDLLRSRGATVIEYEGDYGKAVEQGRAESDADPKSYFVDDENSSALFLGYAVAAGRMDKQFKEQGVAVDADHPLFVYIPCGVGGAPGGVAFGEKLMYGDNVHVFFVEPTQCPCMVVGLASGKMSDICVQDVGLSGITEADGLAVGRPSGLVSRFMDVLLSGEFTVEDAKLNPYLRKLWKSEGLYIEPSSCATFIAPSTVSVDAAAKEYIEAHGLADKMDNATHIVWATGGSMVPQEIRDKLLAE